MRQVKDTVFLFKFLFPKKSTFPQEKQLENLWIFKRKDPSYTSKDNDQLSNQVFSSDRQYSNRNQNGDFNNQNFRQNMRVPGLNFGGPGKNDGQNSANARNLPSSSNRQSSSDQDENFDSEDYDKYDASAGLVKKNPMVPGLGLKLDQGVKRMDGLSLDLGRCAQLTRLIR